MAQHEQNKNVSTGARMATLDVIIRDVLPNFISPAPTPETLRNWFADLPQFKANPAAKRGGGAVYYSTAAVEKFFRVRMTGGAL